MTIKSFITILTMSLNLIDFNTGNYINMSQNPIILDMDFCTDVDDAVAVRMATTLDGMNVCSLMAVGLCTTSNDGTDINLRAANGLLNYDGYGTVPIGSAHIEEPDTSPYWNVCAGYSTNDFEIMDAVDLYKIVLDSCYNKVTIVTTGYLNNIRYLLEDEEGYDLVKKNCERIVVTGGSYPSGKDNNFSFTSNAIESAKYVEENCPVQIVYVPYDVGGKFTAGGLIQSLSQEDVLSKALCEFGTQDGRAAWDPTAMFIAAVPEEVSNFDYIPVSVKFDTDGSNMFTISSGAVSDNIDEISEDEESSGTENKRDRLVVRYKSGISASQYQDMIEGILSYEYLR